MTALITDGRWRVVPDVPHTAQISSPTSYCLFVNSNYTDWAVKIYYVTEEANHKHVTALAFASAPPCSEYL